MHSTSCSLRIFSEWKIGEEGAESVRIYGSQNFLLQLNNQSRYVSLVRRQAVMPWKGKDEDLGVTETDESTKQDMMLHLKENTCSPTKLLAKFSGMILSSTRPLNLRTKLRVKVCILN